MADWTRTATGPDSSRTSGTRLLAAWIRISYSNGSVYLTGSDLYDMVLPIEVFKKEGIFIMIFLLIKNIYEYQ